jgi:hypothetical protein
MRRATGLGTKGKHSTTAQVSASQVVVDENAKGRLG